MRHQYGISVAESQTFLRAKRPQRRRAWRNGCFRRLFTYTSYEVHFRSTESQTFYRSIMTADDSIKCPCANLGMTGQVQTSSGPSGWFSKSRGLLPWVSEVFLACGGNRARKVSGTQGRGLSASVSFLSSPPLPALLLAPFFARSLTLVPRSLLLNRTETLATQAKSVQARAMRTMETRN